MLWDWCQLLKKLDKNAKILLLQLVSFVRMRWSTPVAINGHRSWSTLWQRIQSQDQYTYASVSGNSRIKVAVKPRQTSLLVEWTKMDRVDIPLTQRYSTHKWTLRARLHDVGRGKATSSILTSHRRLPEQYDSISGITSNVQPIG